MAMCEFLDSNFTAGIEQCEKIMEIEPAVAEIWQIYELVYKFHTSLPDNSELEEFVQYMHDEYTFLNEEDLAKRIKKGVHHPDADESLEFIAELKNRTVFKSVSLNREALKKEKENVKRPKKK